MLTCVVAALGLQQLLPRVRSPLQAQQVWQVTLALQAQPLLKQCARVVGGVVVGLIKVSLWAQSLWVCVWTVQRAALLLLVLPGPVVLQL